MRWRRTLVVLHRDIGYLCFGMVLIYGISGIATNHRQHWDYNYSDDVNNVEVGLPSALLQIETQGADEGQIARDRQDDLVARLQTELGRDGPPRKVFWRGPNRLSLFFADGEKDVVDYNPSTGSVEQSSRSPRPLFRQVNYLHLNEARSFYTWLADLFAVALIFLACSGILILKGKNGLRRRGGVLTLIGIAIPVIAFFLLR